eukprot:GABV01008971.1.p1 GENE.GABV01008971.1~~GABV01008971.1.p1  ORF type:complete len:181 (-),score=39.47 GABV01008971.1:142-684(-)
MLENFPRLQFLAHQRFPNNPRGAHQFLEALWEIESEKRPVCLKNMQCLRGFHMISGLENVQRVFSLCPNLVAPDGRQVWWEAGFRNFGSFTLEFPKDNVVEVSEILQAIQTTTISITFRMDDQEAIANVLKQMWTLKECTESDKHKEALNDLGADWERLVWSFVVLMVKPEISNTWCVSL